MHNRAFTRPEPLENRIAPAVATVFQLENLNGDNGVRFNGDVNDAAGFSVTDIGDVNNDGFDDIFIGTPGASNNTGSGYVVFGTRAGLAAAMNLFNVGAGNGFRLVGAPAGASFGFSASAAGDVNGDGVSDFIVGAPGAELGGTSAGAAYVILGRVNGSFPRDLDISAGPSAPAGFRIDGAPGDRVGTSVAAGDVNGDGRADLIVGTPGAGGGDGGVGVVYGLVGAAPLNVSLAGLGPTTGFRIAGGATGSAAGAAVAAGDFNGDGKADLIIGAPARLGPDGVKDVGATYVVFGPATTVTSTTNLDGTNGFTLFGSTKYENSGSSLAAVDVNGDGMDDVVVGGAGRLVFLPEGAIVDQGVVHVVFGRSEAFPAVVPLSKMPPGAGYRLSSSVLLNQPSEPVFTGLTVADGGDIQGDGFHELLIGAISTSPNGPYSGSAYILFGKPTARLENLSLANLDRFDGARFDGEVANQEAGFSISGAGDFDGDGFGDLLIGAPGDIPVVDGGIGGATYLVFGTPAVPNGDRAFTFTDRDGEEVAVTLQNADVEDIEFVFEQSGQGAVKTAVDSSQDHVGRAR